MRFDALDCSITYSKYMLVTLISSSVFGQWLKEKEDGSLWHNVH